MQGIVTGPVNLSEITTYIFDLDGVLWRGDTAIDGAIAAVKKLREAGKRCLFCTNNSSRTAADYVEKLDSMGLHVKESNVLTSSGVTAHYLSGHFTGPFLAYVVGEKGIDSSLQKIGARIVPDSDLDSIQSVDCVVVGIDREFNYKKLQHAQRLIQNGALFIATNRDGSYPVEDGVRPGGGSIVAAIEVASGITPVTVGKPRPVMVGLALQKLNVEPGEVAFVGDRLDTDIACARRAGVTAICVLTGVTTEEKAVHARGELRPHYIYATLADLCHDALAPSPGISSAGLEDPKTPVQSAFTIRDEEDGTADNTEPIAESTFTIPDEDVAEPEITSKPAADDDAPEASFTDDIDQLFEESKEQPAANSGEDEKTFDLDTAMSVVEEKEPELPVSQMPASQMPPSQMPASQTPASQTPASQTPASVDQKVEETDSSSSEDTFNLDTAMSSASTEEAPAPTHDSDADAKKEKSDEENFDWKLD